MNAAKHIKGVVAAAAVLHAIYLLGAFVSADTNAANWSELGRVFAAGAGGFFAAVAYLLVTDKIA